MLERDGQDRIIVFTGPDGSGRKSVAEAVGQTFGLTKVISYATRTPRRGEMNGHDYHFVSKEAYRETESRGEFLESVEIDGNLYGIRRADIEKQLQGGEIVYLILNREGAQRLKEIYGSRVIRLFLYADRRTLEERQRALGLNPDVIAKRLSHYEEEMAYRSSCEHSYGNYDLGDTVSRITETLEGYFQRGLVDKD